MQARPNSLALFVPAEVASAAYYHGLHKHYMVSNCIFRMGGAAVLLSNKAQHARVAKYQLHCNVRVHTGQSDDSYRYRAKLLSSSDTSSMHTYYCSMA